MQGCGVVKYGCALEGACEATGIPTVWSDAFSDEMRQPMKIDNAAPYIGALVTGVDIKRMTAATY